MNNVTLIGRLVREPELRYTNSGTARVRFTLAVDRKLSKEKKQQAIQNGYPTADFINCVAWSGTGELAGNYLHKGNRVGVQGQIQTGSYEKDGRTVYTTDILINSIDFIESVQKNNINENELSETKEYTKDDVPF